MIILEVSFLPMQLDGLVLVQPVKLAEEERQNAMEAVRVGSVRPIILNVSIIPKEDI